MSIAIPKQAMVLAAGQGKRMRPITDTMPKPMVPVAGRALIDYALDAFIKAGVTRIVVNSSYKAEMLEAFLAKRTSPKLLFSREPVALETGGGIKQALHFFDQTPFYVANCDVILVGGSMTPSARLAAHFTPDLDALLLLHPREKAVGYEGRGDFFVDAGGLLTRRGESETAPYVYAGVQLLHPRFFADSSIGVFSLNLLFDRAMQSRPPRIRGVVHDGDWLHVGDPQGLKEAEAYLTR